MPRPPLRPLIVAALLFTGCDESPAGTDAAILPPFDAGPDAGSDAGLDAGLDAGADAAGLLDAATDAGSFDGSTSAGVLFPPRDHRCAAGAARPCPTTVPVTTDAERTVDVPRDMPPGTYSFVIRTWSMPPDSFAGVTPGFNLDGLDSGDGSAAPSATCEELSPDYESLRDPGHEGVDDAIAGLVSTIEGLLDPASCPGMVTDGCVDATLAADIADGAFLILVEVTGLESFAFDDAVEVALYEVAVPGGGPPALATDGRLAPGQTFDTVRTIAAAAPGDVFDGRLRVVFEARATLPRRTGQLLLPLELDGAELRADVAASGLDLGSLGATTEVAHFVAEAERIMPGIGETVRSVLESVADVEPESGDPAICTRLSSGYSFDAVPAVRR